MTKEQKEQLIEGSKRKASIDELCLATKLNVDVVREWLFKNQIQEPIKEISPTPQTIQNEFEENREIKDAFLVDVAERHEGNKIILTYQSRLNY